MLKQVIARLQTPPLEWILFLIWLLFLVLGILSNPLFSYPGRDSGIFLYIGSLILKGKIPYIDVWENKGPLVFYINALGLFLTHGSRWGVWLIEFLFFYCAGCIGYTIIKNMMGAIPSLIGTFIWVTAAGRVLQGGNFSEEYSLLFSFIALLFYLRSLEQQDNKYHPFMVGVSLAGNILLRPNNISMQVAVIGVYFILMVISKDFHLFFRRIALAISGTAAILVPVILYFAGQHALVDMVNVVLVYNYQYSDGGGFSRVLDGIINASTSIGWLFVVIASTGLIFSFVSLARREQFDSVLGGLLLIMIIGWPIETGLSSLSGRNYPHYFLGWAPYLGFLSAFFIYVFLKKIAFRSEKYTVIFILILLFYSLAAKPTIWKDYGAVLAHIWISPGTGLEYRDPLVLYIEENTLPQDKVFIWGFRPVINFMSGRESPTYFLAYPIIYINTPLGRHWADQFYSQFTTNPPDLVVNMIDLGDRERIPDVDPQVRKQKKIKLKEVVLAYNYNEILDFIHQNYTHVDTINGYDIYRLNTRKP
jgi:hypothetical protein